MTTQEQINAAREAQMARGEADDFWWLTVRNPNREIHLFELGYAEEVEEHANPDDPAEVTGTIATPLPPERRAVVLAQLGAPADTSPEAGWDFSMAPGRPSAYLEPKEWDAEGTLLPIRAKAGVTLHLLPDVEPGTEPAAASETPTEG